MIESAGRKKARSLMNRSGYKVGGHVKYSDEAEDKPLIKREVSKAKIKLKEGGCADGGSSSPRADRLRRGGKTKKGKGHTTVNVVVGGQHPQPVPVPKPVPVPVPVGGPGPIGAGAPPPGAMPPDGVPPPMPQGMPQGLKTGGKVKIDSQREPIKGISDGYFAKGGKTKATVPMTKGAGGGLGRIAKAKAYGA